MDRLPGQLLYYWGAYHHDSLPSGLSKRSRDNYVMRATYMGRQWKVGVEVT